MKVFFFLDFVIFFFFFSYSGYEYIVVNFKHLQGDSSVLKSLSLNLPQRIAAYVFI